MCIDRRLRTWFAKAASLGYANRDAKRHQSVKGTESMDQRVHPVKIIPTGECSCDDIVKTRQPSKQG